MTRMTSIIVLLMINSACAPDKGSSATGTTDVSDTVGTTSVNGATDTVTPTSGTPDLCGVRDVTDDCCCFSVERLIVDGADDVQVYNTCGTNLACPEFAVQCSALDAGCPLSGGDGSDFDAITVDDVAALDCALLALRDGAPGRLSWAVEDHDRRSSETYYILSDRAVFSHRVDVDDFYVLYSDVAQSDLAPAEVFDSCIAAVELRNKVKCLADVTTGLITATCAMGAGFNKM